MPEQSAHPRVEYQAVEFSSFLSIETLIKLSYLVDSYVSDVSLRCPHKNSHKNGRIRSMYLQNVSRGVVEKRGER